MKINRSRQNLIDLFLELVRTDFVLRYRNSALGFVWVFFKPFLLFFVILVIFSWFFKHHDPFYRYNLFLGVIIFSFFSEATQRGVMSLWEKASIMLKINFPKELTIYTSVFNSFISFLASFVVYLIFWLFTKPESVAVSLLYFLLQIFILTCLVTGLNFFLSIIFIFFRDFGAIWEIVSRLLFYMTPIIFPFSIVPEEYRLLVLLNPIANIIVESRKALITGEAFSWDFTCYTLVLALIILKAGHRFFYSKIKYVAERF